MAYTTKSTDVSNGRYTAGGTTEVNGAYVGWWERTLFKKSPMDVNFPITKRYALRPDLVALDMYGKATLAWVVLQYNTILDINEEFVEGRVLVLPTKARLFSDILKR